MSRASSSSKEFVWQRRPYRRAGQRRLVLFTDKLDARGRAVLEGFTARGVPTEQVSDAVMHAISQTETPQGILAVLAIKPKPLPLLPNFLLILDGMRDPGNLGTILRTAAAAGVQGVLLAPGCADVWSPKVVRGGMGAHFRLPIESPGLAGAQAIPSPRVVPACTSSWPIHPPVFLTLRRISDLRSPSLSAARQLGLAPSRFQWRRLRCTSRCRVEVNRSMRLQQPASSFLRFNGSAVKDKYIQIMLQ